MELTLDVLNVRFGSMSDDNNNAPFHWGKLTFIETEPESRDGFGGLSVGEIRLDTENQNALAKKIHSEIISGAIKLPARMVLKCDTSIKKGEVSLTVKSHSFVK